MSRLSLRFLFSLLFVTIPITSYAILASVKGSGMANATIAHPVDSFAVINNPAGMAWVGNRWDLGVFWNHDDGEARFSGNPDVSGSFNIHETDELFLPEFGVNRDFCDCDVTFTIGFTVYNRSYSKTNFEAPIPIFGTTKPGIEYIHQTIAPSCTIKFGPCHALGASVDLMAQRLKVNGLENFATEQRSNRPSSVTGEGYDYSLGAGITVGWISQVSDCVSIGVAWSPEISMQKIEEYEGLLAKSGKLHIPERFMGGFAIEAMPGLFFELDVEHIAWDHISSLHNTLLPNFEEEPSFGDDDSAGLGWRDQTNWRLGIEFIPPETGLSFRLGYIHARSPIKSAETMLNSLVPIVVEDWLTFGSTWRYDCQNECTFYFACGLENSFGGREAIPDELGGGNVGLKQKNWQLGISWGHRY